MNQPPPGPPVLRRQRAVDQGLSRVNRYVYSHDPEEPDFPPNNLSPEEQQQARQLLYGLIQLYDNTGNANDPQRERYSILLDHLEQVIEHGHNHNHNHQGGRRNKKKRRRLSRRSKSSKKRKSSRRRHRV